MRRTVLPLLVCGVLLMAAEVPPALADATVPGPTVSVARPGSRAALAFRLGLFSPRGDSDLWDYNGSLLTTGPDEYEDASFGMEFVLFTHNHVEVALGFEAYSGSDSSIYREFVDQGGLPIAQRSELSLVPLTAMIRWLPAGRYGLDAAGARWVPRKVVPYVSAGLGVYLWEFWMDGDFVDLATLEIFTDRFVSDGATLGAAAALGLELPISASWSVVLEGRYHWAKDDLGSDFIGFDDLDLGGLGLYVGMAVKL